MTEFTSDIKTVPHSDESVFSMLSDLTNLERVKALITTDKVKNLTFDRDSCSMEINPIGKVVFTIVEREPNKTVKFEATSPVPLNLWIQVKSADTETTKIKMTLRADLPPFLKPMLSGRIQKGLDEFSDVIAALPYE